LIRNFSGSLIEEISLFKILGSVRYPVSAAAAAVSGLTRYTPASAVPERPSKLRLKVLKDTPLELGD
jgi:hypothetical protein